MLYEVITQGRRDLDQDEGADPPGGEEDAVVEAVVLGAPVVLGEGGEEGEVGPVVEARNNFV